MNVGWGAKFQRILCVIGVVYQGNTCRCSVKSEIRTGIDITVNLAVRII
jgi:hypothetical protein